MKRLMAICLLFVPLAAGCSHTFEVVNRFQYTDTDMAPLKKKITVGIIAMNSDNMTRRWLRSVGEGLMRSGSVVSVTLPYYEGSREKVDLVVKVDMRTDYSGSGWNYLITFPGFLIFTPAWHGFVYKADLNTRLNLYDGRSGKGIDYLDIPMNYNIRHAAINRTWCEIGWFEVGFIPFVSGFFWIQYDDSVTEILVGEMGEEYGNYIAGRILKSRARDFEYGGKEGVCPKCDATNPATATFCGKCGAKLVADAAKGAACLKCGQANQAGAKFCEKCGAKLAADAVKGAACVKCGQANQAGAKFCQKCGAKLVADAAKGAACLKCDHRNPAGAKFCEKCGEGLE